MEEQKETGYKIEGTDFLGVVFLDKEGNKILVEPHKEFKKQVEQYLDKRNGIKTK